MKTPKVSDRRCTYKGKSGRCSRRANWSWQDDSMKIHYLCTQHRDKMRPSKMVSIPSIPQCVGDTNFITCKCTNYSCLFKKKDMNIKVTPVNKGKGIHC